MLTIASFSVEYGNGLSQNLLDLFHKILDRNPDTRITMRELRVKYIMRPEMFIL